MCRRPEDIGLYPDGSQYNVHKHSNNKDSSTEPNFTRSQAISKPSFWLLALFTALVFPVQAGISLHQAPHLIERGLSPAIAALVVSCFSLISGLSALLYGYTIRRLGVKANLAFTGSTLAFGIYLMLITNDTNLAFLAAILFGIGIGGILCILPIVWADFFGRESFGSIRGIVLSVQISSQALGPLISGILRDMSNNYDLSLIVFMTMSILAAIIGTIISPPDRR
tara:strand:- start:37 stop:711 length:675 start_codon:yes stop_codon:yes gene_type:complete